MSRAGEGLNGFPGLPEAHRDELGTIALDPPQKPGSAVARRALVAFDSSPLHVRRICGSILSPDRSTPDSRDHLQQLPAGTGSKRNLRLALRAGQAGDREASTPRGRRRPGMMPGRLALTRW